jgi:hypothetical protein
MLIKQHKKIRSTSRLTNGNYDKEITMINVSFSYITWREQVNFQWDDNEVRFVLDQHAELEFYSAS